MILTPDADCPYEYWRALRAMAGHLYGYPRLGEVIPYEMMREDAQIARILLRFGAVQIVDTSLAIKSMVSDA